MRKYNTFKIAVQNIKYRVFRSTIMTFFVFMLGFIMFAGSIIIKSTENGLISISERLGADLIAVPESYFSTIENALFKGEPCTVYFDKSWEEKIRQTDGIKRVSSQLFLATLADSDCCDSAVLLIAFDPETDFVIQPWLNNNHRKLKDGQVIAGSGLNVKKGDTLTYYGTEFEVANKLEKTGMGYDYSVFLKYSDAYKLAQSPNAINYMNIGKRDNIVSMIVADVDDGENLDKILKNLISNNSNSGIKFFTSESMLDNIAKNFNNLSGYSSVLIVMIFIMSSVSLISLFSVTINERRNEFGIYISIGARKYQIFQIIIIEALLISLIGGLLGILFAMLVIYPFGTLISSVMEVPYLNPNFIETLFLFIKVLVTSAITGIISALYSAFRLFSVESGGLIKGG